MKENYANEQLLQIERLRGDRQRAEKEGTVLNEWFHFINHTQVVSIHVLAMDAKDAKSFLPAFYEAMHLLAKSLFEDNALSDVEKVAMHSWLVEEKQSIVTWLGFAVSETDPSEAFMDRNDFIQRYHKTKK